MLDIPHGNEERVAGGGLLHRRTFIASALAAGAVASSGRATSPESMKVPGAPLSGYGERAPSFRGVERIVSSRPESPGTGSARTPLQFLEGTITPNSLHFERSHNGVPDIDPTKHELIVHGLVRRPLVFRYEDLLRYPRETRIRFIECSGNSGALNAAEPIQASAGQLNGLVSCAEWTGVRLSHLLDEAGVTAAARWVQAEGADAAALSRSIPLSICMDDAIIALFQNGEPIRPEQGFPMRLLLPGIEGNASVKWLRRLNVLTQPAFSRDESSKYSDLRPDGVAELFSLRMGVKSVILQPSLGFDLNARGVYEINGLAWSGRGKVRQVEVSADGGASWAKATLSEPVLSKAVTRFRILWRWDGGPATLMSRAFDETGAEQPRRTAWLRKYENRQGYHNNSIQSWHIDDLGRVSHVYA